MSDFSHLGLGKNALSAVSKLGYEIPTPVQTQAIPVVLQGLDCIAAASTGTGKTAAFLLPLMDNLAHDASNGRSPRILILTPTRELAQQIARTAIAIGRETGSYVTCVYGGAKYGPQIKALDGGTDILISTPGRLIDLMKRRAVDLSRIEALVLDEADRMLDMGFLPDVKRIVSTIPKKRQTLLFSATIDASVKNNFKSLLNHPEVIQIAQKGETAESVRHYIIPVKQGDKADLLKALLDERKSERTIVFARTKARVRDVFEMLDSAQFKCIDIHSDKSQAQRKEALSLFRKGKANVIVATDVLARGIDVPAVDLVINYDLPDMAEDYIHRIGRSGRAGEKGLAVSFVSPTSVRLLDAIENLIGHSIGIMHLKTYDVDTSLLSSRSGKQKRHGRMAAKDRTKKHLATKYNYAGWKDKGGKTSKTGQKNKAKKSKGSKGTFTDPKHSRNSDKKPRRGAEWHRNGNTGNNKAQRSRSKGQGDGRIDTFKRAKRKTADKKGHRSC